MTSRVETTNETVDFVVVGSGRGQQVMARELSQAGFTTVVLEQGPRLGPADFEHDELKYVFLSGITVDPRSSPQTFHKNSSVAAKVPHGDQYRCSRASSATAPATFHP